MKSPEQQFNNLNQETGSTENLEEKQSAIPPQYKGMPSEVVEELWQNPIYIDEEKNKAETERRQAALEEIKKAEQDREAQKEERLKQQYSGLSDEQKATFPDAQKGATRVLTECIQGKREIEDLSPEESFVLQKLKTGYKNFKKDNPDKPFSFDFAKGIDKSVYNNLAQRLSFSALESKRKIYDTKKATAIREELGIPKQEIQGDNLTTPEQNLQQNHEDLEDTDFEKFKVKKGETDIDVFWYEYGNTAAKKLKGSGKLEWGKERIYFDIPLDNMEELRDLAFEIAKSEKIPIAFKHLDVQKTHQVDLKPDSETTRFVANFASVEDAKRFYQALQQKDEYTKMKSDRNLDYHGYNIDGVAHYASGYREKREPLKRIIETAQQNPDNTYSYYSADGSRQITITEEQYNNFVNQFNAMPDPEETWKKTNI
ncbi:MAG: hypothetical protein IT239_06215 [Bacteroidia bacterium]|nr:hypothetical protein [Bacteroidia bacterium]